MSGRSGTASAGSPFVPAHVEMPELTAGPLAVGALLGIAFGASSMYLVPKVGVSVSASIPVAVLSITIFRGLSAVPWLVATGRLFGTRGAGPRPARSPTAVPGS